jgi:fluoride exporter
VALSRERKKTRANASEKIPLSGKYLALIRNSISRQSGKDFNEGMGLEQNHSQVQMRNRVLVAIGGGIGSLLRFAVGGWFAPFHPWQPLATLVINVSGCFLISILHFVSDPSGRIYLGPESRLFLLVGFCGGYTTFSSFSLLSLQAIHQQQWLDVWANILLSHLLCLVAVWLGYVLSTPFGFALAKSSHYLRRKRVARMRRSND